MRKQHAAPVVEDYDSFEPVNAPTLRLKQVLLARGPPPELVELRRFRSAILLVVSNWPM